MFPIAFYVYTLFIQKYTNYYNLLNNNCQIFHFFIYVMRENVKKKAK